MINFDTIISQTIKETDSGWNPVVHQKTYEMEKKIFIICKQ